MVDVRVVGTARPSDLRSRMPPRRSSTEHKSARKKQLQYTFLNTNSYIKNTFCCWVIGDDDSVLLLHRSTAAAAADVSTSILSSSSTRWDSTRPTNNTDCNRIKKSELSLFFTYIIIFTACV